MTNAACISCTYPRQSRKVQKLKSLYNILDRLNLNRPKNLIHFNWGLVESCKLGIPTCAKINLNKKDFNYYSTELNKLLSAYIEKSDKDERIYHDILSELRGDFSAVYTRFEVECRKAN